MNVKNKILEQALLAYLDKINDQIYKYNYDMDFTGKIPAKKWEEFYNIPHQELYEDAKWIVEMLGENLES